MKKEIVFFLMILLLPEISCLAADPLSAIDILLEPDETMLVQAQADNARLLKNDPQGFALDATHVPHITVLQCYVRTRDLERVFAAVKRVADKQDPAGIELEATGYFYTPWQGSMLAGIRITPENKLLHFQQAILAAVLPFTVMNGNAAAFVSNENNTQVGETTVNYVNAFIAEHTGKNYNPHVTIGLGREDFLKKIAAEPYQSFTFKIKGVSIYHLGDFGTAKKKLWVLPDKDTTGLLAASPHGF